MKITIITVAYNSEKSIADTIESVLAQTYDEIEHIIIDGASTDRTIAVAETYRGRLEGRGIEYRIISEPDDGIYNAMNKGIREASGEIIGILNCGDYYEKDALQTAAETFLKENCDLFFANIRIYRRNGKAFIKKAKLRSFHTSRDWNHPTMFVTSQLYKKYPFRELGIHDDYGFFLQMRKINRKVVTVDKVLANFRMGGASNRRTFVAAKKRIMDRYRYCYRLNGYSKWYFLECVAIEAAKMLFG